MTNYTITSNNDITNLQLSDGAYRCYMLLQSLSYGDKTTCFPSIKYMACALGRSCRTINRYITELVGLNLITRRRRGSISNLYTLVQKKIQQGVDRLKRAVQKQVTKGDVKDTPKQGTDKQTMRTSKNYYKKSNTFNDYTQRKYNFDKLEKGLLGSQKVTEFGDLLE